MIFKKTRKVPVVLTPEEKEEVALRRAMVKAESEAKKKAAEEKEAAILARIPEDQPAGHNIHGERMMISSIFRQAIDDVLAYPHPDMSNPDKYKKDSHAYLSIDAKRFLSKDNELFCIYCELLDMDPAYAEKSIHQLIKNHLATNPPRRKTKKQEKKCNAITVTILNQLLSVLATTISITRLFVEESACAAA